jgi:hypothetical protein
LYTNAIGRIPQENMFLPIKPQEVGGNLLMDSHSRFNLAKHKTTKEMFSKIKHGTPTLKCK